MIEAEDRSKPGMRFSLLNLVLLITAVATTAAALAAWRESLAARNERDRSESELRQFAYRFGEILDGDPYGLVVLPHHEAQRDAPDTHRWEWTIKVPADKSADLCFATGATSTANAEAPEKVWDLGPGIHRVSLEVYHGREHPWSDEAPKWWMVLRMDGERFVAGDDLADLLPLVRKGDGNYSVSGQSFGAGAVTDSERTPLDLIRYSVDQKPSPEGDTVTMGFRLGITLEEEATQ